MRKAKIIVFTAAAICLLAAPFAFGQGGNQLPIVHLGVMGASSSDEYQADDNRGGAYAPTTMNWVELLAHYRNIDVGPWGTWPEPRRSGYEYNWARSGALAADAVTEGQASGLAQQVAAGEVDTAVLYIGGNDFNEGSYSDIYNGIISGQALQDKIDGIISSITQAVDTVRSAGSVRFIVLTISDPGQSASEISQYPDASKRQRVTDAVNSVNSGILTMASQRPNVAVFDLNHISLPYPIDANGNMSIGGQTIALFGVGNEPHKGSLDGMHAGTVVEGILANLMFINVMDTTFNATLVPFSDQEILSNAGITIGDTTPPTAPGTPALSVISSSAISLAWAASTDNVGVTGYMVERCSGSACGAFVQIATLAIPSYSDTNLSGSTTYRYRIRATDAAGNRSAYSGVGSATTLAPLDTTSPTVPTTLSATAISPTQVNLSWTASTDNVGVAGYQVYRNGIQVATTALTSFTDSGLAPSTTYTFTVAAYDAANNKSGQSLAANATTLAQTGGAIMQVSGQNRGEVGASTLSNLAFSHGVTAGNQIIVVVQAYRSGVPTINTPSKASGTATISAFRRDASYTKSNKSGYLQISVYRAKVTGAGSLTLRFSGWFSSSLAAINEYSGMSASPVDGSPVYNTATSNTESTGNVVTTSAGMVLMCSTQVASAKFSYAQSDANIYSNSNGASQFTGEAQQKTTGNAGTYNLTAGTGNNWFWVAVGVAYKAGAQ